MAQEDSRGGDRPFGRVVGSRSENRPESSRGAGLLGRVGAQRPRIPAAISATTPGSRLRPAPIVAAAPGRRVLVARSNSGHGPRSPAMVAGRSKSRRRHGEVGDPSVSAARLAEAGSPGFA